MPSHGVHRRADDPPDVVYGADDKVGRLGDVVIKYAKPLVPIVVAFVTWFMVTVWEPIQQVPALVTITQTLVRDSQLMQRKQNVTDRILCFNLDIKDRAKYDINCGNIPLPEKVR